MSASRPSAAGRDGLLSASALMAAGTVVSRLTGFVRTALIAAAIGGLLNADLFQLANNIPNALYILVAGGVFNVVLVPQLIRAMRNDADGGEAYANRVITLGVLVLAGATALLIVAIPLLMHLMFKPMLFTPELAAQRASAARLMLYCMPQVFFYGVFVLVGQVLNARRRFGPMMWTPILNNIVSCAILISYIKVYGSSNATGGFSHTQELLLGVGSTAGIVVQTLALLPFLRSAGFTPRLRFDLRGVGLGHTLRLGMWTLLFVIVNQIAFFVVNRIASGSTIAAANDHAAAAGSSVYQSTFLITQVPHAIITVSIVTATMPLLAQLAADGNVEAMRAEMVSTVRLVMVAIVPAAVAIACLGRPLTTVMFDHGKVGSQVSLFADTVIAFSPGMVLFTLHYLMLRGFYAREDTRTPFLVQMVLSATNIGAALLYTHHAPPSQVATRLALAYGTAYLFGFLTSFTALSARIGSLLSAELVRFLVRLALACAIAAGVMLAVAHLGTALGLHDNRVLQALLLLLLAGAAGALAYLAAARAMSLREVTEITRTITKRR